MFFFANTPRKTSR